MAVLYAESAPITSARKNRNIYQAARELKGLTQEVAAERLDLSVESLGAYEQERRRPPDSTVLRMAQLYDFPYLCYQHIQSGDLAGVLPQVGVRTLEHATMRLIRLIGRFAKDGRLDQLMEINEDGIIRIGFCIWRCQEWLIYRAFEVPRKQPMSCASSTRAQSSASIISAT